MNEKNKKTDKFTYIMILIMGIIGIAIISYFIIFGTVNLINGTQVSKMLIDMNIYQTYYDILNVVSAMMIPIFLTIIFMSVPYIINSIILGKIFIKKYKKYKGEKKNNIIKIIITGSGLPTRTSRPGSGSVIFLFRSDCILPSAVSAGIPSG